MAPVDRGIEPARALSPNSDWGCPPRLRRNLRVKTWKAFSEYLGGFSAINSSGVIAGRAYFDGGTRANAFLHLGDGGDWLFDDPNLPLFLTEAGAVAFPNGRGIRIGTLDGGFSEERRPSRVFAFTDLFRVGIEDWYSLVVFADGTERRSGVVLVDELETTIRATAVSADGEVVGGNIPTGSSNLAVAWFVDGGYQLLNSRGRSSVVSVRPPYAYGWSDSSMAVWCLSGGTAHSPAIEGSVASAAEGGGVLISTVSVGFGIAARWQSLAWSGGDVLDVSAAVDGGFESIELLDIDEHLLAVGQARTAGRTLPIIVQLE